MNPRVVACETPVVLLGGGPLSAPALTEALSTNPVVVAADGGADAAVELGLTPVAVYGDMDSITPATREALNDFLIPVEEQDSTDFDKALRHITAPLVIGFGFLDGRFDHALAALTVLANRPDRRVILVGQDDIVTLAPPRLELPLPAGTRVSLFPLGPVTGRSEGLRWPIDGLEFTPAGRIGTSNAATGPVRLRFDAPRMALILPVDTLATLQAALLGSGSAWPARAG